MYNFLQLQPEDLEDVDSPDGATAIKEEDTAIDIHKEKDPARQEKTRDSSESSELGSDDDSIFWKGRPPLIVLQYTH